MAEHVKGPIQPPDWRFLNLTDVTLEVVAPGVSQIIHPLDVGAELASAPQGFTVRVPGGAPLAVLGGAPPPSGHTIVLHQATPAGAPTQVHAAYVVPAAALQAPQSNQQLFSLVPSVGQVSFAGAPPVAVAFGAATGPHPVSRGAASVATVSTPARTSPLAPLATGAAQRALMPGAAPTDLEVVTLPVA